MQRLSSMNALWTILDYFYLDFYVLSLWDTHPRISINSPVLPTQVFHGSLSLVGGREICLAHSSEAVHRLSHTPDALGQGKAVMELEDQNAYDYPRITLRSCPLSAWDMGSRSPVGQPGAQRVLDQPSTVVESSSHHFLLFLACSLGRHGGKVLGLHKWILRGRNSPPTVRPSSATLTGNTGLRTDTQPHSDPWTRQVLCVGGVACILEPLLTRLLSVPQILQTCSCHRAFALAVPSAWYTLPP